MAQTPESKVRAAFRKEVLKYGVKKVVNYYGTMYSETGHPDVMCLVPGGKMFYVELKAGLPRMSPAQLMFAQDVAKLGFLTFCLGARGVAKLDPMSGRMLTISHRKPREVEGMSVAKQTRERVAEMMNYLTR